MYMCMYTHCTCTCMYVHGIGKHKIHGQVCLKDSKDYDPLSSLGYLYTHPIAGNLPVKLWLLGN